jgi:hypothetical protein
VAKLSDFIDQDVIDDYLEGDPNIVQGKLELAEMAVDFAQSIAPVDSGDYRDGVVARKNGTGVGIYFTDEISNIVEYGSEHSPAYAVRARTIEEFNGSGQ